MVRVYFHNSRRRSPFEKTRKQSLIRKLPDSWRRKCMTEQISCQSQALGTIVRLSSYQKDSFVFSPTIARNEDEKFRSLTVRENVYPWISSVIQYRCTQRQRHQQLSFHTATKCYFGIFDKTESLQAEASSEHHTSEILHYGPLGRKAMAEFQLNEILVPNDNENFREAVGLSQVDRIIQTDSRTIQLPTRAKSIWHTACAKLGIEIPHYRHTIQDVDEMADNESSGPARTLHRATALTRIKMENTDIPSQVYDQLKDHDHVGKHPNFDWIEVITVGIARTKQRAENLAALDQIALWKEATGNDLTLPFNQWPDYFSKKQRKSSRSHPHLDTFAQSQTLLELTRCSKIRYDHDHHLPHVSKGRQKRNSKSKSTTRAFWTADAETYFLGKHYFSDGDTPEGATTRASTKTEAEQHALIGLLEQNKGTPLYDAAMNYKSLLEQSPSGKHLASLLVPRLADDIVQDLQNSLMYKSTNDLDVNLEHQARKDHHQQLKDTFERDRYERRQERLLKEKARQQQLLKKAGNQKGENLLEQSASLTSGSKSKTLWEQEQFKIKYHQKHNADEYYQLEEHRNKLPINKIRGDFLMALESNQVVVVSGGTGSGKSTQCPQYILEDAIESMSGATTRIIVTQPRRIAAVSVSQRVLRERFHDDSVGYSVRFRSMPPRVEGGSIEFVTTGMLLRRLLGDFQKTSSSSQLLNGVSHIIIDEVHERDINTDFLLILFKDYVLKKYPDLKLVLMSATLDSKCFSQYFSAFVDKTHPVLSVPAETRYPVDVFYLDDILAPDASEFSVRMKNLASALLKHNRKLLLQELEDDQSSTHSHADHAQPSKIEVNRRKVLQNALSVIDQTFAQSQIHPGSTPETNGKADLRAIVSGLVSEIALHLSQIEIDANRNGSILCFLPGMDEIKECMADMEKHCPNPDLMDRISILTLHSSIPPEDQQKVFETTASGKVKVILATNIAESSITIDDVLAVVDSGLVKEMTFDPNKVGSAMETSQTSKASATQRLGRAGRLASGSCYRVYSRGDYEAFQERPEPEIKRTRLESICLQQCSMIMNNQKFGDVQDFLVRAIDPPERDSIIYAMDRLRKLGAVSIVEEDGVEKNYITPLGQYLAQLPLDPSIGKMLVVGVVMKCLGPSLTAAACFSCKSVFYTPPTKRERTKKFRALLSPDSDIFASIKAFDVFWSIQSEKGWKQAKAWAYENHVSISAMIYVKSLRSQLLNELLNTGLVQKRDIVTNRSSDGIRNDFVLANGAAVNKNSDCELLVRGVWCTAFPENLAHRRRIGAFGNFRTSREDAELHSSSILFHRKPPIPAHKGDGRMELPDWCLFRDGVLTSKFFLRDCSSLSPEQILLFGGFDLEHACKRRFGTNHEFDKRIRAVMDKWIIVEANINSEHTFDVLIRTRENLEMILEQTVLYPSRRTRGRMQQEDHNGDDHHSTLRVEDSIINGIRQLFDKLYHDEESRFCYKEERPPLDDFHDYFLDDTMN